MPISLNPFEVARYAVHWRSHLTTGWMSLTSADSRAEAITKATTLREKHGGQTRIVAQEVVQADGLGAAGFVTAGKSEGQNSDA